MQRAARKSRAGQEAEAGESAGAGLMILGIIVDLTGLLVIMQSMESYRRVDAISGQAFPRLMVIGREAVALKYREAWMPPGE